MGNKSLTESTKHWTFCLHNP